MTKIHRQSEASKAFNALESGIDIKVKNTSAPKFGQYLKDGGYLDDKGSLTHTKELKFLSDKKVIVIQSQREVEGMKEKHIVTEWAVAENNIPYFEAYQKLLSKWKWWQGEEEKRLSAVGDNKSLDSYNG